jgi:arylsulfatase
MITNLRADPYERWSTQSWAMIPWYGEHMFLMGPAQALVAKKMQSLEEFPPARGSSLSLGKLFDSIKFAHPGQ